MTAPNKKVPLTVNAFDIKEISARMQQRATDINVHLPLSAALELASSVFGYNNYHEVAPLLKGQASLEVAGVNVTAQMIEAVFAAYEKATGSKEVNLVVSASDPAGDFSYVVFKLTSDSFIWMLEEQLTQQSHRPCHDVVYPSYAWRNEVYLSVDAEKPQSSYFYTSGYHKHSDGGGGDAVSALVSPYRCFVEILFELAEAYAPEQIIGRDKERESSIIYTTNEIKFAGDSVEILEDLIDSCDFQANDPEMKSLFYGDGHIFAAHSIFVQK